jgi:hypothetical protein
LSREIDVRQVVIEQSTDEITSGSIPVSALASIPQYTCKISGIAIGFMICARTILCAG